VIEHVKEGVILLCKVDGGGYESCLPYSLCHVLFGFIYFFFALSIITSLFNFHLT